MIPETALVAAAVRQTIPAPLHTVVMRGEDLDGAPTFSLIRIWTAADADACRLCHVCSAHRGHPCIGHDGRQAESSVCAFSFQGEIANADAALFSPDFI